MSEVINEADRVAFTKIGNVEILTNKIPGWADWLQEGGYQTCLFYDEQAERVQHYDTEIAALKGHIRWISAMLKETKR